MATLNHSTIIKGFEKLVAEKNPEEFFFNFLKVLKFSSATIKRLRAPGSNRNVANIPGDFGLAKQIYFHPVKDGGDLRNAIASLIASTELQKQQIRFFLATDFTNVVAYDKRVDDWTSFAFDNLRENYEFFLPLTGLYEKPLAYTSHPADVKACEKMGRLYDIIRTLNHYDASNIHELNVFLTRLLFCFFAEDTGIFPRPSQMTTAIESLTQADGSDLSDFFSRLFVILDAKPEAPIRKNETASLTAFPYVNGGLFRETCPVPTLNAKARTLLLECGKLEWNQISPVIFGSMFQSVMDPEARHELGAHYTSEKNILKVIHPLFLDDLKEELQQILRLKGRHEKYKRLESYRDKLATMRFLDPACGSGNFLIVAYREIKLLELQALSAELEFSPDRNRSVLVEWEKFSKVSIDQFYGIEIEEFPVEIARVSMWLMEHVMHLKFGEKLGLVIPSIPLKNSACIVCANALQIDWNSLINFEEGNIYIFGNPPFNGSSTMNADQKKDLLFVAKGISKAKSLDLVNAWYLKSAEVLHQHKNQNIHCAFVSTNSICQGELVYPVWKRLLSYDIHINFAHTTFKWANEAKHNAGVYCVIVGFSKGKSTTCKLFTYATVKGDPEMNFVSSISPYLIPFRDDIFVELRAKPLSATHPMVRGNQPSDGGSLILSQDERDLFISTDPSCAPMIRPLVGAKELLHKQVRYCLWLPNYSLKEIANHPAVQARVERCKAFRLDEDRAGLTQTFATTPHLFAQRTQVEGVPSILIPAHSSENRDYIPMAFVDETIISTNANHMVPNGTLYDFGILESRMHMTWMRTVCGRLESRYRYSRDLCYNTFPWPKITEKQRERISNLASNILMTREFYPDMTLADLYDPEKMPEDLRKAHSELDLS